MPPSDPELLLSDYQLSGSILLSGVNSGSNSTTTNTPDMNHVTRYRRSCLGGTFDRLHAGHKILLSEACLIATDGAVIGLAQGALLEQKLLRELILPFDRRLAQLNEFLISVQSHLKPDIVPIEEPFGPSITDGSLDVMILSDEVKGAIEKVNQLRQQAKLPPLSSHVINGGEMLSDDKASTFSPTDTVSSSAGRTALLAELVKPVTRAYDSTQPYVIGITGMLASGKSSVCKRLEAMGAFRLDADKLGHLAYVPATAKHDEGPAYRQVIAHFGDDIVNEDGFIDRKKLGTKVFADPNERKQLEQIVWPAIQSMVERDVKRAFESGKKIIVLEAAVLLEAEWDSFVNEVWCVHVPTEESVKRALERDGLAEEQVRNRIAAQIGLAERVDRSNVILSTLWAPEVTQQLVEKSWRLLLKRTEQ